jgi:CubicO group peptidase (beta-lactamase class C family)
MVIVDGYVIWQGPDVDRVHNTWSVTKSFTSTAMGLLLGEDLAGFTTLAGDHVPSLAASYPALNLHHFVTHGSGYDAVGGEQSATPFTPAAPRFTPPGGSFLYWDAAINQFANVLTQIGVEPLVDLFRREVADPIGMPSGEWSWGDFGFQNGLLVNGGGGNQGEGIRTNARTLARFCHLFLAGGSWDGVQLVPSEWVAEATRSQVPYSTPNEGGGIGPGSYGYGWFTNGFVTTGSRLWPDAPAGAYMAAGFNQNRCWIIPEWSIVVVRTGTNGGNYTPAEENEFLRRLALAVPIPLPEPGAASGLLCGATLLALQSRRRSSRRTE